MMKSDHGKLWPPNLSRSPFPQPLLGADAVCPRARSGCQAGSGDPRRGGQPEAAATSPSPELGAGAGARAAQTLRPSPLSLPGVSSWQGRGTRGSLGPASSARSGPPAWGVSGRGRKGGTWASGAPKSRPPPTLESAWSTLETPGSLAQGAEGAHPAQSLFLTRRSLQLAESGYFRRKIQEQTPTAPGDTAPRPARSEAEGRGPPWQGWARDSPARHWGPGRSRRRWTCRWRTRSRPCGCGPPRGRPSRWPPGRRWALSWKKRQRGLGPQSPPPSPRKHLRRGRPGREGGSPRLLVTAAPVPESCSGRKRPGRVWGPPAHGPG